MIDHENQRFTFEKCSDEAYIAFRGVGGKKPSEGRGDWAKRFLSESGAPQPLEKLAGKYHGDNIGYALFWANQIMGVGPSDSPETVARYVKLEEVEKVQQALSEFSGLKEQ